MSKMSDCYCRYCGEVVPDGRIRLHHRQVHRVTHLFPATFVGIPCKARQPPNFAASLITCPSSCICNEAPGSKSRGRVKGVTVENVSQDNEPGYFADDEESGDEVLERDNIAEIKKKKETIFGCLFCDACYKSERYFWSHFCMDHKFPARFIRANWMLFTRVGAKDFLCVKCRLVMKKTEFYQHVKHFHKYRFKRIKKNLEKFQLLELGNYYFK